MPQNNPSRLLIGLGTLTLCFGGLGLADHVKRQGKALDHMQDCAMRNLATHAAHCDEKAAVAAYSADAITGPDLVGHAGIILLGAAGVTVGLRRRR